MLMQSGILVVPPHQRRVAAVLDAPPPRQHLLDQRCGDGVDAMVGFGRTEEEG